MFVSIDSYPVECRQAYRLVENRGENQQENRVNEVNSCNRDVESVGLLVHPWPENADTNQEAGLDDNQCNSLGDAAILAKSNEQSLDQYISQTWHDEIVGSSSELDV